MAMSLEIAARFEAIEQRMGAFERAMIPVPSAPETPWDAPGSDLFLAIEEVQEFLDGLGLDAEDAGIRERLRRAVRNARTSV